MVEWELRMDPVKVTSGRVADSNLQGGGSEDFLIFFFRWFIRNFSSIVSFHVLTSPKFSFVCASQADQDVQCLKATFTLAPLLAMADPNHQFVVKFGASDIAVLAVLPQRLSKDGRLHPCAFLSCKLPMAERNHDVEDKASLAVKEWRSGVSEES